MTEQYQQNNINLEGSDGSSGACPCLKFSQNTTASGGVFELSPFVIQKYDASLLSPNEIIFQLPPNPSPDQQAAIKEVGDSTVPVRIEGNGNTLESPSVGGLSANVEIALQRACIVWQWDGASWRIAS